MTSGRKRFFTSRARASLCRSKSDQASSLAAGRADERSPRAWGRNSAYSRGRTLFARVFALDGVRTSLVFFARDLGRLLKDSSLWASPRSLFQMSVWVRPRPWAADA